MFHILFHPFSYNLFRLSFTVDVGGVDEVSSVLHESVQDFEAIFFEDVVVGKQLIKPKYTALVNFIKTTISNSLDKFQLCHLWWPSTMNCVAGEKCALTPLSPPVYISPLTLYGHIYGKFTVNKYTFQ